MIAMMGGGPYPYGPYDAPDHQWHQLVSLFVLFAGPALIALVSAAVRGCQQWTKRSSSSSAPGKEAASSETAALPAGDAGALPAATASGASSDGAPADKTAAIAPVRASDAERDRTAQTLSDAIALGRLTFDEGRERIGAALGARHRGELDELVADLPTESTAPPSLDRRHGASGRVRGPVIAALAAMAVFAAIVTQAVAGVWAMWPLAIAAVGLLVYAAESRRLSARPPVGHPHRAVVQPPSGGAPGGKAPLTEKAQP
jgi:DUF1707 SHOCT-like domain